MIIIIFKALPSPCNSSSGCDWGLDDWLVQLPWRCLLSHLFHSWYWHQARFSFLLNSQMVAWEDIHAHLSHLRTRCTCLGVVPFLIFLILKIGTRQKSGFKSNQMRIDDFVYTFKTNRWLNFVLPLSVILPLPAVLLVRENYRRWWRFWIQTVINGSDISVIVVRENHKLPMIASSNWATWPLTLREKKINVDLWLILHIYFILKTY